MSMKKVSLRQCIGCREMKNKKEMIRVIRTTEDEIMLGTTGRGNGRGACLRPSTECLKKVMKEKELECSFKMAIPREMHEILGKEMEELGR